MELSSGRDCLPSDHHVGDVSMGSGDRIAFLVVDQAYRIEREFACLPYHSGVSALAGTMWLLPGVSSDAVRSGRYHRSREQETGDRFVPFHRAKSNEGSCWNYLSSTATSVG